MLEAIRSKNPGSVGLFAPVQESKKGMTLGLGEHDKNDPGVASPAPGHVGPEGHRRHDPKRSANQLQNNLGSVEFCMILGLWDQVWVGSIGFELLHP